jgi:single stranded DNA-binding protein
VIGITACFTGRLGKDAEVRNARDGAPWASFPVAVDTKAGDETPATWVRVALFGNTVTPLTPRLIKGALVYCEGRMTLGTWTDRDGQTKSGLNLSAWEVVPMAQIGRQRPRPKPRSRDEREAVPFDDAIPF